MRIEIASLEVGEAAHLFDEKLALLDILGFLLPSTEEFRVLAAILNLSFQALFVGGGELPVGVFDEEPHVDCL